MSLPNVRLQDPEVIIKATRSFAADYGELERQFGQGGKEIRELLKNAFRNLEDQTPPNELPIEPYGTYGDSYQYRLNERFAFTYKRVTDRDSEGKPLAYQYYLKNILRLR